MITRYHARYYAAMLSQKSVGGELDSLSQSLLSSTVDINPQGLVWSEETAVHRHPIPKFADGAVWVDFGNRRQILWQ